MFMQMDKRTVANDLGFSVRRDDIYTLSYHEGERILKFGLELSGRQEDYNFILYSDSSLSRGWQPPYDKEAISPEKKKEILKRVLSAVEFMGKKALVV
jgi:hypothetical protein